MFKSVPPEEINRKFLHVLVIAFPLGVFYGPQHFSTSRFNIFVLTFLICLLSLFIDLLRIRNDTFGNWFSSKFGRLLRAHENAHLTGATYIFGGISFCACPCIPILSPLKLQYPYKLALINIFLKGIYETIAANSSRRQIIDSLLD